MKIAASMVLAVLIGAGCRWFDIPVPAPPRIVGAVLVVAMTFGYLAADKVMAKPTSSNQYPVASEK
jgi:XapX domain-containing protein